MTVGDNSDVLFLIIARGGSKGVPGKNLRRIGGQSLIGMRAVSARRSRHCARLMLSTDSEAIRDEGRRHGVDAPFLRPPELASDTASSADVVLHAMDWIERNEGRTYDAVMLLEAATPFARADHYDQAVALFSQRRADLVVGMREMEVSSSFVGPMTEDAGVGAIIRSLKALNSYRRQDQPPEYTLNGALYLMRWDSFRQAGRMYWNEERSYGLLMDRFHSLEIDNLIDLSFAEFLAERGLIDMRHWRDDDAPATLSP